MTDGALYDFSIPKRHIGSMLGLRNVNTIIHIDG